MLRTLSSLQVLTTLLSSLVCYMRRSWSVYVNIITPVLTSGSRHGRVMLSMHLHIKINFMLQIRSIV